MNKLVVITGAGGVLCSCFAQAMAGAGYDIALLDINEEAAKSAAEEIKRNKSVKNVTVKAYKANVLDKDNLEEVHQNILYDLGKCSVLINGAGGNSPKCITAHEMYEIGDEKRNDVMTFFNLDKTGFDFVFNLNLMGTLLPTQVFGGRYAGKGRLFDRKYFIHERIQAADENSSIQRCKIGSIKFYPVACRTFC